MYIVGTMYLAGRPGVHHVPFQLNRLRRSGSALLIILGCVALLTILVVAFLVTARTEFTTSNFYAKGVNTKLLSENVINLVMAQLREGARSTNLATNAPQAWASQPGMIRTYGVDGTPSQYFKLYSWDNMIGSGQFNETDAAEVPPTGATGWSAQPNIFTDLNEPVNGTYPIIDPAAEGSVEGFSYTAQTDTSNQLSMPVKWLYVLKDGSLSIGTATGSGTTVHITNASTTNPVIGRVAFWTDDETCKVNINTASEGTFWDVPVANNNEDFGYSTGQSPPYGYSSALPAGTEYQRVPGHPATTSLSTVFGYGSGAVLPDTSSENAALTWPLTPGSYQKYFAPYYSLSPRYAAGGSMGGAQPPFTNANYAASDYRLFDSVDELAFDPTRTPLTSSPPATPALYPTATPAGRNALSITPQIIDQRRFFITAHSRAPEETLFGTPRISLWPLQVQTEARTAKDNLLAFCSTINGRPYYFQRATYFQMTSSSGGTTTSQDAYGNQSSSSQSATQDFPDPPTAPGTIGSKTGVQRNEDLYGYLQALTGQSIPGFGGSFLGKYPGAGGTSDRDEILTEMFDLIRSGVNTIDCTPNLYPQYTYTLYSTGGGGYSGGGSTVPIAINTNDGSAPNTHGLGRIYDVAEATLGFAASDIDINDGTNHVNPGSPSLSAGPGATAIGAEMPDPNCYTTVNPGLGTGSWKPYLAAQPATKTTPAVTAVLRRISIGPNLPWACEVDYPNLPTGDPRFLYWDTATQKYGYYYYSTTATKAPYLFVYPPPAAPNPPTPLPATAVTIGDPQTAQVTAYLILRPYSPVTGFPVSLPRIRIQVSNLDSMHLNGQSLGFPSSTSAVQTITTGNWASEYTGGGMGESWASSGMSVGPNHGTNTGSDLHNYPFVSQAVPVSTTGPAYPSPYGGEDPEPSYSNTTNGKILPPGPIQIHNISTTPNAYPPVFAASTMNFTGNPIEIQVLDGFAPSLSQAQVIQSLWVNIPSMTLPVPSIEMCGSATYPENDACMDTNGNAGGGPRLPGYTAGASPPAYGAPSVTTYQAPSGTVPNPNPIISYPALDYYWQLDYDPRAIANRIGSSFISRMIYRGDTVRSFVLNPNGGTCGDLRLLAANPLRTVNTATGASSDIFVPLGQSQATWFGCNSSSYSPGEQPYLNPFIRQIHSLFGDTGDASWNLPLVYTFAPPPSTPYTGIGQINQRSRTGAYGGQDNGGIGQTNGSLFVYPPGTTFSDPDGISSTILEHYAAQSSPAVTPELQGAYMDGGIGGAKTLQGDWSNGLGPSSDGALIFKPDEGVQMDNFIGNGTFSSNYYQSNQFFTNALSSYAPNRQVPSAVIFGTLPSIVFGGLYPWDAPTSGGVPWCTLLFCPNPASNDGGQLGQPFAAHPGFGVGSGAPGPVDYPPYTVPPDHLFLDLFWMPIVDPYAISEPFSTAGKVNLNYEIVPFGNYIHRSTALHAVMKSTRILAIPTQANDGCLPPPPPPQTALNTWPNVKSISYTVENPASSGSGPDFSYRYNINLPATIDDFATTGNDSYTDSQFYTRFITQHDLFRSASEICNIFLVPEAVPGFNYFSNPGNGTIAASAALPPLPTDAAPADMEAWWSNFRLTGDNGREMPYKYLYPRLTTKSNDFEVHMRVQVLSQTTADRASGNFDPTAGDSVVGEYRGSAIVERYLDPNQTTLPDFATTFPNDPTSTVDNYIHYRIVNTHAFAP